MEKKHLNIYLEHTNITCFTECSFLWLYISWEMTSTSIGGEKQACISGESIPQLI